MKMPAKIAQQIKMSLSPYCERRLRGIQPRAPPGAPPPSTQNVANAAEANPAQRALRAAVDTPRGRGRSPAPTNNSKTLNPRLRPKDVGQHGLGAAPRAAAPMPATSNLPIFDGESLTPNPLRRNYRLAWGMGRYGYFASCLTVFST